MVAVTPKNWLYNVKHNQITVRSKDWPTFIILGMTIYIYMVAGCWWVKNHGIPCSSQQNNLDSWMWIIIPRSSHAIISVMTWVDLRCFATCSNPVVTCWLPGHLIDRKGYVVVKRAQCVCALPCLHSQIGTSELLRSRSVQSQCVVSVWVWSCPW